MAGSSLTWRGVPFKSPHQESSSGFYCKSRGLVRKKVRKLQEGHDSARREIRRLTRLCAELQEMVGEAAARVRRLECEQFERFRKVTRTLPVDPPVGCHGYGARNGGTVRSAGPSHRIQVRSESHENLLCLAGRKTAGSPCDSNPQLAPAFGSGGDERSLSSKPTTGSGWQEDHSNQIGQEKILVVLAIRASQLPPPGTAALRHGYLDMRVVAVRPGKSWKRENVAAVYEELAKVHGVPRQILSDGAIELRESAVVLKTQRSDCITLQDFKHKAANFLETALGEGSRFNEFTAHVGRTRAAIQQTELAHLTPPGLRTKARFMNLGTLLNWGQTVLWLLDHPEAKSRQGLSASRLESKLGWLREFVADLAAWNECQHVIQRGLECINSLAVRLLELPDRAGSRVEPDGGPEARPQQGHGRTPDCLCQSRGEPGQGGRTPAPEHRNPGIQLCPLQAIGRSARQGRLHEPGGRVCRVVAEPHSLNDQGEVLSGFHQTRQTVASREPRSDRHVQTRGDLPRNETGHQIQPDARRETRNKNENDQLINFNRPPPAPLPRGALPKKARLPNKSPVCPISR